LTRKTIYTEGIDFTGEGFFADAIDPGDPRWQHLPGIDHWRDAALRMAMRTSRC